MPETFKKRILNPVKAPFTSILKLRASFNNKAQESVTTFATAFLIAPAYVLTAAHMLQKQGWDLLEAEVRFGQAWVPITHHAIHPQYELGNPIRDLAIGRLASARQTPKPMTLRFLSNTATIPQNTHRFMAGFGELAQSKLLVSRQPISEAWPNQRIAHGGPLAYATGTTNPGMSGGPVLSTTGGEVDGVISGLGKYGRLDRDVAAILDETGGGSAKAFIDLFKASHR